MSVRYSVGLVSPTAVFLGVADPSVGVLTRSLCPHERTIFVTTLREMLNELQEKEKLKAMWVAVLELVRDAYEHKGEIVTTDDGRLVGDDVLQKVLLAIDEDHIQPLKTQIENIQGTDVDEKQETQPATSTGGESPSKKAAKVGRNGTGARKLTAKPRPKTR